MTKGQQEIIRKLRDGEVLRRGYSSYEWVNCRGSKRVNAMTVFNMVQAGLLYVGALPGESKTRHLPTEFALAALEDRNDPA